MTAEIPRNQSVPQHETLKPFDRLLVASANVIDQLGECRLVNDKPFYDAEWHDDTLGYRFMLHERRDSVNYSDQEYTLEVFEQFSSGDALRYFRYGSLMRYIDECDAGWHKLDTADTSDEKSHLVSRYLQNATAEIKDENGQFMSLMLENNVQDPRLVPKLRRFARGIFRTR